MTSLHPLLRRQLQRLAPEFAQDGNWQKLFAAISAAYEDFDSDRKILERAIDLDSAELTQASSEMRGILRALPDPLLRITSDNRVIRLGLGSGSLQLPPGALDGPQNALAGSTADDFWKAVEQVRLHHTEVSFEYACKVQSHLHYYEIRLLFFVGEDLIGITRDVTERKNAEIALRERTLELHELATTDSLTGTRNRRAIFEFLSQQLDTSQQAGRPVAVIMADVDRFKTINDRYGHIVGDLVLKKTAKRLASGMRGYDAVGRYGGEEFLIVLPDCNEATAAARAEELRTSVANYPLFAAEVDHNVTCSFGVSGTRDDMYNLDRLVGQADAALYCAKQAGRNRVAVAERVAKEDVAKEDPPSIVDLNAALSVPHSRNPSI